MQRLKGKEESAKILSTDFLKNIDQIVKRLSRDTQVASNATGLTDGISKAILKVIESGKFGVSKGKVVVTILNRLGGFTRCLHSLQSFSQPKQRTNVNLV